MTHRFERLLTFPRATANAWERENAARHARVGERVGDVRERECVCDDAFDGVGAGAGAGVDEVERRGAARGRERARGTVDDGAAGCRRDGER